MNYTLCDRCGTQMGSMEEQFSRDSEKNHNIPGTVYGTIMLVEAPSLPQDDDNRHGNRHNRKSSMRPSYGWCPSRKLDLCDDCQAELDQLMFEFIGGDVDEDEEEEAEAEAEPEAEAENNESNRKAPPSRK